MLLLPVTRTLGILGIPEIVLVLRLGQPRLHEFPFPGLAALGLKAVALAVASATIGKKKFLAVQALASGFGRLHRVPQATGTNTRRRRETTQENPTGRRLRSEKKEEEFSANPSKKIQRKKIPFQIVSVASVPFQRWQIWRK